MIRLLTNKGWTSFKFGKSEKQIIRELCQIGELTEPYSLWRKKGKNAKKKHKI